MKFKLALKKYFLPRRIQLFIGRQRIEIRVSSFAIYQARMRAFLDNLALFNHADLAWVLNGGKSMSNDDASATELSSVERFLHNLLWLLPDLCPICWIHLDMSFWQLIKAPNAPPMTSMQ